LKLKQLFNALKIQSFAALQAPVDGLSAVKLNPDCKCSLCSGFSAHMLMMHYIPYRSSQDALPVLEVVHAKGGPPWTGILQEEKCLPRVGEQLCSLNEQVLAEGRQGRPQVMLVSKCSWLRAVCHTAHRAKCSAHSGCHR